MYYLEAGLSLSLSPSLPLFRCIQGGYGNPLGLFPYLLMGIITLPTPHRLVQRLNEEMLTRSLVRCLAHAKYSTSSQRRAQFVVTHNFNWGNKANQETGGESWCFPWCILHYRWHHGSTRPHVTGESYRAVNLASFQKWTQDPLFRDTKAMLADWVLLAVPVLIPLSSASREGLEKWPDFTGSRGREKIRFKNSYDQFLLPILMPKVSLRYMARVFRLVATPPVRENNAKESRGADRGKGYALMSSPNLWSCAPEILLWTVSKCFSRTSTGAPTPVRPELWHRTFYIQAKKRVHSTWLPCDKATLAERFWNRAILAGRESAGCVHQHNSSVTLRAEIGKPVPFLYFCSFFSTHWKLPPGS